MDDDSPNGSGPIPAKRIRWIHRIGYLTTAIVALEFAAFGALWVYNWERRHDPQFYSGTNEHELRGEGERWVRGSALKSLTFVPPANALSGDGLRLTDYREFTAWFDDHVDGYDGDGSVCLDGVNALAVAEWFPFI